MKTRLSREHALEVLSNMIELPKDGPLYQALAETEAHILNERIPRVIEAGLRSKNPLIRERTSPYVHLARY